MKNKLSRFAVPYVVWMAIFVVAPIVIMVIYAFSGSEGGFTLDNFVQMGGYASVFGRSFKLALIATAICLLVGYPVSYLLSREGERFRRTAMVLIMLPMWMNFLLRTYSWMTILENHGLLNQLLEKIGILALYNHITGYFGDILSYSRLMALMLAGSVIAQVFNTLGAIPGNVFIFIIISMAGNALNFALNLLGCYVHDLRLQCLEYFNKFYQDGGKPFRPLDLNTKYYNVVKD